ncbi:hypothetical protein MSAN_00202900 [Mycena sanguinolenta]|uniref:F-box domain-containing protein n=1 Tax=Mycena sanguinolenta TaxID=230812 RepID=A0A8H6ZLQ5_9AGAR|nr:hypothetical protein MSAN_00202900 [Mycena sanguinolenta]
MTIELPQELIDTILDDLAADPDSSSCIKTCALVCSAWVPRSRLRLFNTCLLNSHTISVFSDLLRSTHCTFLPHVRNIQIDFKALPSSRFSNEFALDLRSLTGVRSLEMTLEIGTVHAIGSIFFRTAFSSVTRLVLDGLITLPSLISTLCLFPNLHSLRIHLATYRTASYASSVATTQAAPPPALVSLALCANSVRPILAWLHTTEHLFRIRSLKLPSLWRHEVAAVCQTLQRLGLGGTLRHLHCLDIPLTWLLPSPSESLPLFDLSFYPSLHTLVLRDSAYPDDMLRCITQLAAPSLECLIFDLDIPSYRCFNWAALDDFLDRYSRFQDLRSVVFIQFTNYTDPAEDKFLRDVLPLLAASGVMRTKWLRKFENFSIDIMERVADAA